MLKEDLDFLVAVGKQQATAQILTIPGDAPHRRYLPQPGGNLEVINLVLPRQHTAATVESLMDFVNDLADASRTTRIWCSRTGVVALIDDASRWDRVSLPLALSVQLQGLQTLEKSRPWHGQRDFVNLLRINLAGCLGQAPSLLPTVRQVAFRQQQQGDGAVQHGKSSLGKRVEAQLDRASDVPEEVVLQVPVFHGPLGAWTFPVSCAIDIDAGQEKFCLVPLPNELERAQVAAEDRLAELIASLIASEGSDIHVYRGVP